eukprot:gene8964-12086_t
MIGNNLPPISSSPRQPVHDNSDENNSRSIKYIENQLNDDNFNLPTIITNSSNQSKNLLRFPQIDTNINETSKGNNENYYVKPKRSENSVVVGTKESNKLNQALPDEWLNQRVNTKISQNNDRNESTKDDHISKIIKESSALNDVSSGTPLMSKMAWENSVAKHILSLFATTNALHNIEESKGILNFADENHYEVDLLPSNIYDTVIDSGKQKNDNNHNNDNNDNNDDINQSRNKNNDESQNIKTKKKKKKKTKSKIFIESDPDTTANENNQINISKEDANIHYIQQLMESKNKTEESVDPLKDPYRTNIALKTKDGKELIVRGAPKCYPIWFVTTGEVYADWTELPDGKSIQAQLNVLYEKRLFKEYLGIVESTISTIYREKRYGKLDLSVATPSRVSRQTTTSSINRNNERKSSNNNKSSSNNNSTFINNRINTATTTNPYHKNQNYHTKVSFAEDNNNSNNNNNNEQGIKSMKELDDNFGDVNFWNDKILEGKPSLNYYNQNNNESNNNIRLSSNLFENSVEEIQNSNNNNNNNNNNTIDDYQSVSNDLLAKLWKQLVLTANAMGKLAIEKKRFDIAMDILGKAETWATRDGIISKKTRFELKGHIQEGLSYFFFKQKKTLTALSYASQSMNNFENCNIPEGVAHGLLNTATALCQQGHYKDAHKHLFEFIAMLESGKFSKTESSPKQLCSVAIAYHNLAVVQLKLGLPDLACKNSQNARKIARLCLSYSNRWIDTFQYTHDICINDLKYELGQTNAAKTLTKEQLFMIRELSEAMFDPITK